MIPNRTFLFIIKSPYMPVAATKMPLYLCIQRFYMFLSLFKYNTNIIKFII